MILANRKGPADYRPDSSTICLLNCYADDNKGDHGIILATFLGLRQAYIEKYDQEPKLFAVSTFSTEETRNSPAHRFLKKIADRVIGNSVPQRYLEDRGIMYDLAKGLTVVFRLLFGIFRIFLYRLTGRLFGKLLSKDQRAYAHSGLLVSKGGSIFFSLGGIRPFFFLLRMLSPLIYAVLLGRRPIIFGQSIGPFNGIIERKVCRWVLNRCRKIYVRERFSKELLLELGVIPDRIVITPDAAFLLKDYLGIVPQKTRKSKVLSVTVRRLSTDVMAQAQFESKIAALLQKFMDNHPDWLVQFVPQVVGPEDTQDDRRVQRDIKKLMDPSYFRRLIIHDEDLSVEELCKLYAESDFLLGTRLHSTIFAAISGVPSIVLEYQQRKALGTFELLGVQDYVLDWQDGEESIYQRLEDSITILPERQKQLKTAVKKMITELHRNCQYIINTLEESQR